MFLQLLKSQVNWQSLGLGILTLLPFMIGYFIFHNHLFFNVGLVAISLFIPMARNNTSIFIIVLQFLLIVLCFNLLFFAFFKPVIFVILCALMAFCTIYFTKHGSGFRTIANFIFIPAVYLTCELQGQSQSEAHLMTVYTHFMFLMPEAFLITLVIFFGKTLLVQRTYPCNNKNDNGIKNLYKHLLTKFSKDFEVGKAEINWVKPAIAIFAGVLIAAGLIIYFQISEGEWVIWSTAAVITNDLNRSRKKAGERLIGLFIGIPLGLLVGPFLGKDIVFYSLATFGVMLTLVAFKQYWMAFSSRCFLITLASYIASPTSQIALERLENVILGGIIGMATLYIAHFCLGRFTNQQSLKTI